ncbi:MAG: LON peptidase substrate-binding domain-containing protein [Trueperaceae bacterium]
MDVLAVFPLQVVVFPGMTVPLHVFEERYKRLVRHANECTPPRFAIAPPPNEAMEDVGAARPGPIGTLVDVIESTENLDGTFQILAHGRDRCRLTYRSEERIAEPGGAGRPLWFADVEPWPLERGDPNEERVAAWDALEAFDRYGRTFFAPQARKQATTAMPDDPLYQASFVCANLRLPTGAAQRLLEAESLSDRFRAARAAIDQRLARHDAAASRSDAEQGSSAEGPP